ncbi:nicotinate phosphoribosyltransferase [Flavimarina sp. Hel_I_48]|uniref:nicotinate phosphoribosyltransferase n=1 Tax=Flavimarina sp. Hel_I_48 TaxID=1392488 RepID=UPI0004DF8438|nr:nicotinate phosphoribosyltransferase [Flavimarina sp. Hel_I_48]
MFDFTGTYTDQYQLSMAQVYFRKQQHEEVAVFDYFFRKLPFKGGYAIFAGLGDLLEILQDLRFTKKDLDYLKTKDFNPDFLNYLEDFKFQGTIRAVQEGDLIFPNIPVLQVKAPIIQAQLVETILLNLLNFQTLIATKASRMRLTAKDKVLLDFGLRRAQGPGGYLASKAAMVGGFNGSSNVITGRDFGIPISGTMAHSYIQSYDDELTAFRDFASVRPKNCVLLVDTYDTLKSGIPNAITVAKEMEEKGQKLLAIRLDSGDLAYLSKRARAFLDNASLSYVQIAVSNQLDEYVIKSLHDQGAPIDIFGVGTNLVTGNPDAALDGVYKLAYFKDKPRIKLSETLTKTTLPHEKQVFRISDESGKFVGADAISMRDEETLKVMHHPHEPHKELDISSLKQEALLQKVMENGTLSITKRSLTEIAEYSKARLQQLPYEYKRFDNPHIYKVGISAGLKAERDRLIALHKNN